MRANLLLLPLLFALAAGTSAPAAQTNATPSRPLVAASNTTDAAAAHSHLLDHAAKGCQATASASHTTLPDELGPEALVDGDLATRWSSEYSEPQQIVLKFDKPLKVRKVRLHWENAGAKRYALAASPNAKDWTNVFLYLNTAAKPRPRVDEIALKGELVLALKLDLLQRVNPEWGFSLYEIEVLTAP